MKILLLAPHPFYANRGTPIAVRAVVEALSDEGHSVDLLTLHEGENVEIEGVAIHRAARPPFVGHVPIGPSWQKLFCDISLMREAIRCVRSNHYDVVHCVEESAFLGMLLKWLYGLPFVFDMDSLMSLQIREKSVALRPVAALFAMLEPMTIRRAAGVLAVCPALVEEALQRDPRGRIALLPDLPFHGTEAGPLPEGLRDAPGVQILYVGNLEPYQGIDLLLDAFHRVVATGADASLLVVGGAKTDIDTYLEHSTTRSLARTGRLRFVGPCPIERLGRVLECADILVSPRTQGNNTPMKIYSYLKSGRPVVATRLRTHTQVLNDDVAQLVTPDPGEFAQALLELIRSPDRRKQLGEAGRSYVESEFSEERFRSRLRTFYTGLQHSLDSSERA